MSNNSEEIKIDEPVIIVSINHTYKEGLTSDGLYQITRAAWRVGLRRDKAEYALAVYQGMVKEVYKIYSWIPDSDRWIFNGEVAEDSVRNKYLGQSVKHYRKWGQANPILYVNC